MAAPTFRRDFISNLFWSAAHGTLLPSLTAQFARNDLQATTLLVGLLFVLLPLGNFLSTFFVQRLARSRPVRWIVGSRIVMAVFMGAVALLPAEKAAAWPFLLLLLPASLLVAVVLNLQNSVRHSNYPAGVRGRIFARLTIARLVAMAATGLFAGYALEHLAWGHRWVYGLAAGEMLVSGWYFSKIRVRRERAMLELGQRRRIKLLAGFRLLLEDRTYGQFMTWQLISGFANIMSVTVFPLVMADYLGVGYLKGLVGLVVVPSGVAAMASPLAGKLFDHVLVTRYRGINAALWAVSRLVVFVGVLMNSYPVVIVGCVVFGLGWAMEMIAFDIGHTRFTSVDRSPEYMAIHLTLQGVRGILAPLAAAGLIYVLGAGQYGGQCILIGAAVVVFIAAAGFMLMKSPAAKAARVIPRDLPGEVEEEG